MSLKQDVDMLKTEVKELRLLTLQNAKLTEEMSIIIKGSDTLGVEGIRVRQRKDEIFRERMFQELTDVNKRLDDRSNVILQSVDNKLEKIQLELNGVKEWKSSWDKAIELITSSTTWRILFLLGLGVAGVIIAIKLKFFGLFGGAADYLNSK